MTALLFFTLVYLHGKISALINRTINCRLWNHPCRYDSPPSTPSGWRSWSHDFRSVMLPWHAEIWCVKTHSQFVHYMGNLLAVLHILTKLHFVMRNATPSNFLSHCTTSLGMIIVLCLILDICEQYWALRVDLLFYAILKIILFMSLSNVIFA
jgi:hypothetical protein